MPEIARMREGGNLAGARVLAILDLDDGRTPAYDSEALYASENAVREWRQA